MGTINQTKTSKRFSVLALPYEKRDMAIAKELIIDYENGHIYVMDKTGTKLISITKNLEELINKAIEFGGDNIKVTNPADKTTQILNTVLDNIYNYVNATVEGLCIKKPARLLCDYNITSLNGLPGTIDDVVVNHGDDILLINQDDKKLNGKWKVNSSGNWTRSDDLNTQTELVRSSFFFIDEGTKYASTGWLLTTDNPVIDSSELEFEIFSRQEDILAGFGLKRVGNEFSLQEFTTAGTATKVSWDKYGRIVSWENPTTLEEFGITNAVHLNHIGSGGDQHAIVTVNEHGFSSKEDKQTLDSVFPAMEQMEIRLDQELNTKSEIEFIGVAPVEIELFGETVIIDDLVTESSTAALSANQGKRLKDLLDLLFQNTNEDGSPYTKLWMGTLNQYYNILSKDSTTLYISTDTVNENTALSMGSNVEEIIMMLQLIQSHKVSKDGDIINGDLIVGSSVRNQNLKVYGKIFINGVDIDEYYSRVGHKHTEYYTKTETDIKLKKKADVGHTHPLEKVEGLEEILKNKSDKDHDHNDIYYTKQEIDYALTTKAPLNHKHFAKDIQDLFTTGDSNGNSVLLYLKNMISDPLHRTVTDAQIAKWNQNSGGSSNSIINIDSTHNLNPNSHPDIRQLISEIRDELGNVELLSNLTIKDTINELYQKLPNTTNTVTLKKAYSNVLVDSDNPTNIPMGFTGFNPDIHTLLVFKDSTFFHNNEDYVVNGDSIDILTTTNIGTLFTFVVLWIEGDVLSGGGNGSGTLDNSIYQLLDRKADEDHDHKLSDLIEDSEHRTVTDAMIKKWNTGTGTGSSADTAMLIAAHNADTGSHSDLRKKIDEVYDNMTEIKFKTKVIDLVPTRDNQSEFNVNMEDLPNEKYGHFLIFNSTATTDYVLTDYKLILHEPCLLTDSIKLILFWIDGKLIIQNGNSSNGGPDIVWDNLSQAIKNTINNKADSSYVYSKTEIDNIINTLPYSVDINNLWTKVNEIDTKASKEPDLSNYYTKSQIDTKLADIPKNVDLSNYYNKSEVDGKLSTKADLEKVYTKDQVDSLVNNKSVDLSDYYNRSQIDTKMNDKVSTSTVSALASRVSILESNPVFTPISEAAYNALSNTAKNDPTKIYAIY